MHQKHVHSLSHLKNRKQRKRPRHRQCEPLVVGYRQHERAGKHRKSGAVHAQLEDLYHDLVERQHYQKRQRDRNRPERKLHHVLPVLIDVRAHQHHDKQDDSRASEVSSPASPSVGILGGEILLMLGSEYADIVLGKSVLVGRSRDDDPVFLVDISGRIRHHRRDCLFDIVLAGGGVIFIQRLRLRAEHIHQIFPHIRSNGRVENVHQSGDAILKLRRVSYAHQR